MALIQIYGISAQGLLAADKGLFHRGPPSSDPFCVFSVGKHEVKTVVRSKELNPKWDETLNLDIPAGEEIKQLVVRIYDHDRASKNDPLGQHVVDLPAEDKVERSTGLLQNMERQKHKATGTVTFTIAVTYHKEDPEAAEAKQGHEDETDSGATGMFVIEQLSAEGLMAADLHLLRAGSSDPYCVIYVGSEKKGTTKVIKNTLNPDWTTTFTKDVEITIMDQDSYITFEIYDKDLGSHDDFLGEYSFKLGAKSEGKGSFDAMLRNRETKAGARILSGKLPTKKAVTGRLRCNFMYKAPLDLGEQMTGSHVRLPPGVFGRLVIRKMACKDLKKPSHAAFWENSVDPYLRISCQLAEVEKVYKTAVIPNATDTASWTEIASFWIYERNFEVVLELFDKNKSIDDQSYGVYRFEVPDSDTDWTTVENQKLGINPEFFLQPTASISFEYNVQYDEALEWSSSFRPMPKAITQQVTKKVVPKFKPMQTQDFVFDLMGISTFFNDCLTSFNDLVMWKHKITTGITVAVLLLVCWYSLFFQAMCLGMLAILLRNYYHKRNGYVPPPPPPPPPPPVPEEGEEAHSRLNPLMMFSFLGVITQWTYTGAQMVDMIRDMFTWSDPVTTQTVFIGSLALFTISWVIPLHILYLFAVVYLFTVQSFQYNYPLFAKRYPPLRLMQMALTRAYDMMGMGGVKPWEGTVRVRIIEAKNLTVSEAGHIGSMLGRAVYPDPFAVVAVGGFSKKTPKVSNTMHPVFDADMGNFAVKRIGQKIVIEIWDENNATLSYNTFMGEASFRAYPGTLGPTDAWLPLSRRPGTDDINCLITGHVHVEYEVLGASGATSTSTRKKTTLLSHMSPSQADAGNLDLPLQTVPRFGHNQPGVRHPQAVARASPSGATPRLTAPPGLMSEDDELRARYPRGGVLSVTYRPGQGGVSRPTAARM